MGSGCRGAPVWERGRRRVTVVYLDLVFLLNGVVDYLLLLSAGRLAGECLHRGRLALGAVLGDYTGHIDVKTMTTDRQNKGASLATLRGKRLVITGELEEHQRLSVSTLKQISSTDVIRVEEKYRQPEDILPTHTLVLFTNHLPRVGSTDGGTWRRLIVVPFNATIPEEKGIQRR